MKPGDAMSYWVSDFTLPLTSALRAQVDCTHLGAPYEAHETLYRHAVKVLEGPKAIRNALKEWVGNEETTR